MGRGVRWDPGVGRRLRGAGGAAAVVGALWGGAVPPETAEGASSVPSVGQARGEPGRGSAGGLWCLRWALASVPPS